MLGYNLAGYLIFAFVTSITPGPNNFLLFSYGKNYGFKDSGKLMAGILAGFFVMLLTLSVILPTALRSFPNSKPPSLTFGHETFISNAFIVASPVSN